jgi:hypothetical protein
VFALVNGQKIPLSPEQIEWLSKEALSLAELNGSGIRAEIAKILECDRTGVEAELYVAGLMRMKKPYDGSLIAAPLADPPHTCDQCGRDLRDTGFFFDACTTQDLKWSWMCPPCFFGLGCGVGEGWGQLYLHNGGRVVLVLGA